VGSNCATQRSSANLDMYEITISVAIGMPYFTTKSQPYGGCTILYSKHLKCKFIPVDVGSSRCCAIIMELPDLNEVLWLNENAYPDALINGCFELYVHLALLFNVMLLHGDSPNNMLLSTLVPITKNYRAIVFFA